jgi:hypothetical protein
MEPIAQRDQVVQAAVGAQDHLVCADVGNGGDAAQKGKRLTAISMVTNGDYYFDVDVSGLADFYLHVRAATIGGTATVTPSGYQTFMDRSTQYALGAAAESLTDSGAGNLAAGTARTFSKTAAKGSRIARLKLVHAGAGTVTFDRGEYNGK